MSKDTKDMLNEDPDFIAIKRYKHSLSALEKRYPEGIPNHIVALALDLTEEEVEQRYQNIVLAIRAKMGVVLDE
jgi:hypothetical protein